MTAFDCPRCTKPLDFVRRSQTSTWVCRSCAGHAVNVSVLRRTSEKSRFRAFWGATLQSQIRGHLACPGCRRHMHVVDVEDTSAVIDSGAVTLDVCRSCTLVWFDPQERAQVLGTQKTATALPTSPPPGLRKKRKPVLEHGLSSPGPSPGPGKRDAGLLIVLTFFGLPVESDVQDLRVKPVVTWGLIALMLMVFLWQVGDLSRTIVTYGFIPAEAWRLGGFTLITSALMHGGWAHLLGNLYFFFTFGDNVEEVLGIKRFLLLLLAAALGGNLLHGLFAPDLTDPCVGFSGAISGVMVFYAIRFPRAGIYVFFIITFLRIPVMVTLGFWLLSQVGIVSMQLAGETNISGLAHMGGAAAGLLAWIAWGRIPRPSAKMG